MAHDFEYQDIKTEPLTEPQIIELRKMTGSYQALINRRAQLFKDRGLDYNSLGEAEFHDLLLDHYTFLKRPVIIYKGALFVGNDRKTVEKLKQTLAAEQ